MNVLSDVINIGDEATDAIDITGVTNLNGGSVTIASDLTLATGSFVNEIVTDAEVDLAAPSDNALVTETALASSIGNQAGSGLTYDAVNNEIDLGGALTSTADIATTGTFDLDITGAGNLNVSDATTTNLNSDAVNIGNLNTDAIDITGVTNINGGNLTVASPQSDINSTTCLLYTSPSPRDRS